MIRIAMLVVAMVPAGAAAAECTIENARYKQAEGSWSLTFKPVPQMAAPNQTAAFIIELPNSGLTLEGAVHRPNGFGAALYSISGPCAEGSTERCGFIESGGATIYASYADGLAMLDDQAGAAAPEQLLLPELGQSIWYSSYRSTEFESESDKDDVFTLVGCNMR